MSNDLPSYYSKLAPFRELYCRGNPILTYHKLGPRPQVARLKGLYMSQALFLKQLKELKLAGWVTGSLRACAGPVVQKRIVITFDDGYVNVLRYGLEPLARTKFTGVQFLVADLFGKYNEWDVPLGEAPEPIMDKAQVRDWLAGGHDIGSHTLTHPHLTQLSGSEAREEISASRKKLEDLFGRPIEHFCYPYGDWNEAVRDMVEAAGYQTACTTLTGINTAQVSPFALKRFTARYPSRTLNAIWSRLRAGVRGVRTFRS